MYKTSTNTDPNKAIYMEKSAGVSALQTYLNSKGAQLKVDSMYGPETQKAVTQYGLPTATPTQSGIVQDTSSLRSQDASTASKIDEKSKAITGSSNTGTPTDTSNSTIKSSNTNNVNDTTQTEIKGSDGKTYTSTPPTNYTYNLPPLSDGKKYIYDSNGRAMVQDVTGNITNDATADQEYEKNKTNIDTLKKYNDLYDSYKTGLDQAHQDLIESIKKSAANQRMEMQKINERSLATKRVQGLRTGSAEYTPEIDTGILKAEEEEGLQRLAEIDANMKLALAQAVSAKNEKDFEMAKAKLDLVNTLQKNKEESIQNIYKAYVDNAKLIADKKKAQDVEDRAQRDQALQELSTSAPELVKQYDGLKTQAEKDLWLQIMIKKTGLDMNILKGALEKVRLDVKNKTSIIEKREGGGGESISEKNKQMDDDIANAILDFQDQIKNRGWQGINPQAYEYYKKEIKRLYGANAVLKYDKAIKDAKLEVDYGGN